MCYEMHIVAEADQRTCTIRIKCDGLVHTHASSSPCPYHPFPPPFTTHLFLFTAFILSPPFPLHLLLTPSLSSFFTFPTSSTHFFPPSFPGPEEAPRVLIFPRLLGRRKRRGNYHRPHFPPSSPPCSLPLLASQPPRVLSIFPNRGVQ